MRSRARTSARSIAASFVADSRDASRCNSYSASALRLAAARSPSRDVARANAASAPWVHELAPLPPRSAFLALDWHLHGRTTHIHRETIAMALTLKPSHLPRYRDIARLLIKYGRSDLVRGSGVEELGPDDTTTHPAENARDRFVHKRGGEILEKQTRPVRRATATPERSDGTHWSTTSQPS